MSEMIVLLVDDSQKTKQVLPLLIKKIWDITHLVKNVSIVVVYLNSDLNRTLLEMIPMGLIDICYCLKVDSIYTNTQVLSKEIYKLFSGNVPHALFSSNATICKECMSALAFLFETGLAADCCGIELDNNDGKYCFERTVGDFPPKSALIKVKNSLPQMATFMNLEIENRFENYVLRENECEIIEIPQKCNNTCNFGVLKTLDKDVILHSKVYFVVGAGVKSFEIAERLRKFAQDKGIGFGITRQILNRGWYDNSNLIGISGRTITPNLCVTFGVSGAYQHYIGIKDSRFIISINNDASSAMVEFAQKTIVTDVNDLIIELTK